ncbi:MoeA N-terminal region (domain I and II) [Loktanella fryxellensis]|uniref:Molybdopterin molybdenumtransferase n=1 Tax=Loktanella fryxellensis TaxID=245187 RepID=A0A1H8B5L8_9RHOB|nr:hypothetical protein [Loktanella fryxellensis]SEM77579.1 MoeA N-terminal region (domain I and II) [Loktanella fryxellensis]
MSELQTLEACLTQSGLAPISAEDASLASAFGHVLALPVVLPHDLPRRSQALQAGIAVASDDTIGASPQMPLSLLAAHRVSAGQDVPETADAVLPTSAFDGSGATAMVIAACGPGHGVRRSGHDGRAGTVIAEAGSRVDALVALLAEEAGIGTVSVRRPRVEVALDTAAHTDFVNRWIAGMGAVASSRQPHLQIRTGRDHRPRLALAGFETAWLAWENDSLVLDLPPRFDGMIAGLLALGMPAVLALTGAIARPVTRTLRSNISSVPGLSDLVLLRASDEGWAPDVPGVITLATLSRASAFAIIPPDSEGLPAGAPLAGTALSPGSITHP